MKIENIALFDMDGTLCDYDGAMKRDYNKIKGPNDSEYNGWPDDKTSQYIKKRVELIRNQPGWWENLKKFQLGFDILKVAKELDFEIHILTKGPKSSLNSWTEKARWVNKHIKNTNITITMDKGLVYGKVLVDDYPNYIERWLEWRPRGLIIMPVHEWNKEFNHPNVIPYDGSNIKNIKKAMNKIKVKI